MALKIHQACDWDLFWLRRDNKGEEKLNKHQGVCVCGVCKSFEILWVSVGLCLEKRKSPTSLVLVIRH